MSAISQGVTFGPAKNMLSVVSATQTSNGVTAQVAANGAISLSGSATADTTLMLPATASLASGQYTASLMQRTGYATAGTVTAALLAAQQATQSVVNGDFTESSGNLATNFDSTYGMDGVSCAKGAQVIIATTQWGHFGQANCLTAGHRYLVVSKVTASSSSVLLVSNIDSSGNYSSIAHPGDGAAHVLSMIVDIAADYTGDMRIQDNTASGWADITIEYIMAIDMGTSSSDAYYGLSAATVLELFPAYFDGSKFPALATFSAGSPATFSYIVPVGMISFTIPSGTTFSGTYNVGAQVEAGTEATNWVPTGAQGVIFYPPTGETGTLTNPGNVDAYPVITITGPCSNPAITNETTGESITCNIALGNGDTLILDCRPPTRGCYLNGTLQFSVKQAIGWIHCPPGDNRFSFARAGYDAKRHCTISLQGAYI